MKPQQQALQPVLPQATFVKPNVADTERTLTDVIEYLMRLNRALEIELSKRSPDAQVKPKLYLSSPSGYIYEVTVSDDETINTVLVQGNTVDYQNRISWGTAPPTTGIYRSGDVRWNTAYVAGTNPPGWICTVGGNPGTWVALSSSGGGGGSVIGMESLTISTPNVIPNLSFSYNNSMFLLIVNGYAFAPVGASPPFSVSGNVVTWLSTMYGVNPGDDVVAVYSL
jgi:hypothetical protein